MRPCERPGSLTGFGGAMMPGCADSSSANRSMAPAPRWISPHISVSEVAEEPTIPFSESILHVDGDLVVADKPHFLPVMPAGRYVRETLLTRLIGRLGNLELVPLHRIDRVTAGLRVASLGNSSVRYEVGLFRNDDEAAAAEGFFVHVYVDSETRRPKPLAPALRAALERILV